MLGGLVVEGMGQTIGRFHTQQAAGALAYLAYHAGQPQAREVLVEQLWPGVAPAKGRDRLNVAISSLRRQFEPAGVPRGSVIQGDRHSLALSADQVSTDVAEFRAAVGAARRGSSAEQTRPLLETALALCQGPLLPGHYQDWIGPEQELLTDLLVDAARRLTSLEIAQRRPRAALEVAQRAVAADPLREECHALVLRAAAALGDSALARRHYDGVVELFRREMGCAPSATLAQLARAVDGVLSASVPDLVVPHRAERTAASHGNTTYLGVLGPARQSLSELAQAHRGVVVSSAGGAAVLGFAAAHDGWRCAQALLAEPVLLGLVSADVAGAGDGEKAVGLAERMADAGHAGLVLADLSSVSLLRGQPGGDVFIHEQGQFRLAMSRPAEPLFWLSDTAREPRAYPPPSAESAAEAHLPPSLSGFFGREVEVEAVTKLLAGAPCVVNITGPGGAGKTRLSLEVARAWTAAECRPSWFVPLAALRDAALLPRAILGVLRGGQADAADPLGQAVYRLTREPGLLVLDNFEQLPDAAAQLLATLSARVPSLRCLVTSRRRLGLDGERDYPLPLLGTPTDVADTADVTALGRVSSVAMFVDRARTVQPTFRLDGRNAQPVAELCRRLEGWPLAIELAAPLVQTMPAAALLTRFDEHLDWRATRRSGLPDRQRTLRATLEWSLALLPAPVRVFCEALCVFAGPFTSGEAQAVLDEPLAELYLAHLRDCSLVERTELGQEVGFVLRTPVRELMAQAVEPSALDPLRACCARYFGALADGCPERGATTDALGAWLDRADQRLVELRLALEWGLEHDLLWALDRACALVPLWELRGHAEEGLAWLTALRSAALSAGWRLTGHAAFAAARLTVLVRPYPQARPLLAEAVDLLSKGDDTGTLIGAIYYQTFNFLLGRDLAGLEDCARRLKVITDSGGPPSAWAAAAAVEAARLIAVGKSASSLKHLCTAAELCAEVGDLAGVVAHRVNLGLAAMAVGDLDTAEAALAALDTGLLQQVQGFWAARAAWLRSRVALGRGDLLGAADALAKAASVVAGQNSTYGHEWALITAEVLAAIGDLPAAARCLAAGARWHVEQHCPIVLEHHEPARDRLRTRLAEGLSGPEQDAARAEAEGWTMANLASVMATLHRQVARVGPGGKA